MTASIERWVEEVARTTHPDRIVWCDGSDAEIERLNAEMLADGTLIRLNESRHPNSFLHRSDPQDVARTEHLTFICSEREEDAGPTNNWMSPGEAQERVWPLFSNSMRGRTMYVIPYIMGPANSPLSRVGVEITDSAYVVANMRIMSRMGKVALDRLAASASDEWVPGIHSIGDLSPDRRFILHFPETRTIWSIGSGYGGNALLGKKCYALRIASVMGRDQGWMAEHMLILELTSPEGDTMYVAGAFPSACGKTNLAMLRPPLESDGWQVRTIGEDIAWLHPGPDGRLWAINPEAGYFGVAPGTNNKTNPNAMATVQHDTIFTNVAMTPDGDVWWEGMEGAALDGLRDWQGRAWSAEAGSTAAHPNSRFTSPATNNPSLSGHWEDAQGVPISAILFGGRRAQTVPLVSRSFDWAHGVYMGASMASETTAAATGKIGVVRRDPMAMLPFCGYNMGDYFGHWLEMGSSVTNPPAVFQVNWFRRDADGHFIWPGFGENLRVLRWVHDQVLDRNPQGARETPVGIVPTSLGLDIEGLELPPHALDGLLEINRDDWTLEAEEQGSFLSQFGEHLPDELRREHRALLDRLGAVALPR
jgi:phosphoenolpyruvate carboxykinase (GTP)